MSSTTEGPNVGVEIQDASEALLENHRTIEPHSRAPTETEHDNGVQNVLLNDLNSDHHSASSRTTAVNDATDTPTKDSLGVDLEKSDMPRKKPGLRKRIANKAIGASDIDVGLVPYSKLFCFADKHDKMLMIVGTVGAICNGVAQPAMFIILGQMVTAFTTYDKALAIRDTLGATELAAYRDTFFSSLRIYAIAFAVLFVACFVASYVNMACWQWAGESQTIKIRQAYFKALLRQEIAYFDDQKRGVLTARINADTEQIQDGISDKVGVTIQYLSTFITAWIIAFIRGPILAAILLIALPFIMTSTAMLGRLTAKFMREALAGYAKAGGIAEEALSAIRTVASFGGEQREVSKYAVEAQHIYSKESKKGTVAGAAFGAIFLFLYCSYALGFWSGAKLMASSHLDIGQLVNVFGEFVVGSFSLGHIAPHIALFTSARAAAYQIFQVIDRKSKADPFLETGEQPQSVKGVIQFKNINFAYPTRLHVPILKSFNLTIKAGQTVALVGESGSGKSTIVGLLERYYIPQSGQIYLDGIPIEDLNLHWLRSQIGYVGQEPVLFNGTLRENIALGAHGTDVSDERIWAALKNANAVDFVEELPDKLDTPIGESGANLSGGQRQRIAIARALVADPKIVLLDEATSALDAQSESIVQEALNKAASNRTAIVIAHRLSTVRNADVIVAMRKGEILECGSHRELIERQGYYHALVRDQQFEVEEEEGEEPDADEKARPEIFRRQSTIFSAHSSAVNRDTALPHINDEVKAEKNPFLRVLRMNSDQMHWIVAGIFGAMIAGSITPIYAFIYAHAVASYGAAVILVNGRSIPDVAALNREGSLWGAVFLGIAIGAGFANYLQTASFIVSGEALVLKMRVKTFDAMMTQEGTFFDRKENSVGALTSKLAVESNMVRKLVGDVLGTIFQVIMSVIVGCCLALASAWQLALVALACSPFILVSSVLQSRALKGIRDKGTDNPASQLASEIVGSVRTVASLGLENHFVAEFERRQEEPKRQAKKNALIGATSFGVSSGIVYVVYAVTFIYAGYLMDWGIYNFQQLLSAIITVIFSAIMCGRIGTFLPDFSKAQVSAVELLRVIDRKPLIDVREKIDAAVVEKVRGDVEFDNVHFRYPTRPKIRVHKGLKFKVPAGARVALVGASGCGKSTVIQLLERFYDPERGTITVDGIDISSMSVSTLRSFVSLVGQQPVLFDGTVFENIKYGAVDLSSVSDEDVYNAAKAANVHNFILSLPMKYQTPAGERGGMLSGGQRQRIAIARAVMRKPKILLLDEATSALDAESEVLVQSALDAASEGRTTITIAHRLSTIQNSDLIIVLQGGRVVEQGTHKSLIAQRGVYFGLVQTQMEAK